MDEETDEIYELCRSNMVIKHGRFSKFMACKTIQNVEYQAYSRQGLDKMSKCGDGDIICKKEVGYSMDVATSLIVTLWNKPTGQVCPGVVLIWLKRLLRRKVSPSVLIRIVLQMKPKRKRARVD